MFVVVIFTLREHFYSHLHRAPTNDDNNRENCFVAESAHIFAEPGRDVVVGGGAHIGADVFLHGPVTVRVSAWLGWQGAGVTRVFKYFLIHVTLFVFSPGPQWIYSRILFH